LPVAVKVIDSHPNPDEVVRERFERVTARLMGLGRRPNLVRVLDAGFSSVDDGFEVLWIAMPYVDRAVTLQHRLDALGGLPSLAVTRRIVAELATGLGVLHANQIVHRDLKPENVLVLPDGTVAIIDFDVACLADDDRATPLGRTFGTARYRAPEQLDGECCPASDLWALGVIAFEMYTGLHPFSPATQRDEDLIHAIREQKPERPSALRPGVSPREDSLVLRLLDKIAWRRGSVETDAADVSELKAHTPWSRVQAPKVSVFADTRGDVEAAVFAALDGNPPDSTVVPAHREAALQAAREQLGGYEIKLAVEPFVAPFAFPDWEAKKMLNNLPYRPNPGKLYDGRLLDEPAQLRSVARSAVADAARSGVDRLIAPWTVSSGAVDLQMLVTLRLLGDTLNARDETPAIVGLPVIATVALPVEAVVDPIAQMRVANAFAGYPVDAIRLALKHLGQTSTVRQIVAAVELALLLQDSGRPVSVLVPNSLRELFWAAGVAGVQGVPARRVSQALPGPDAQSGTPRVPPPRFEAASLCTSLAPRDAMAILASESVPESGCECYGCAGVPLDQRVKHPATHNVISEVKAAAELEGLVPAQRYLRLRGRLLGADRLGRELAMKGVLDRSPAVAGHLLKALEEMAVAGLFEQRRQQRLRRVS